MPPTIAPVVALSSVGTSIANPPSSAGAGCPSAHPRPPAARVASRAMRRGAPPSRRRRFVVHSRQRARLDAARGERRLVVRRRCGRLDPRAASDASSWAPAACPARCRARRASPRRAPSLRPADPTRRQRRLVCAATAVGWIPRAARVASSCTAETVPRRCPVPPASLRRASPSARCREPRGQPRHGLQRAVSPRCPCRQSCLVVHCDVRRCDSLAPSPASS